MMTFNPNAHFIASKKAHDMSSFSARPVRTLDDYQMMVALRAAVFMAEQDCPYDEEYDGNDLTASHILVFQNDRPIGTLRLRWFAGFGKLERICILEAYRGSGAVRVMLAEAFEFAARKGYQRLVCHIQARLWTLWSKVFHFHVRRERPSFSFSDYDYLEIDIPLELHPKAITADSDPYLLIRPEGSWDVPGVLELSVAREKQSPKAA